MKIDQLQPSFTRGLQVAQAPRLAQSFRVVQPLHVPSEPTLTLESLERAQSSLRFARRRALSAA